MKLGILVAFALFTVGCGKSGPKTRCEKYGEYESTCTKHKGDEVRQMATAMCEGADEDKSNPLGQMLKEESKCAETATDCTTYNACIEKQKGK